MLKMCIGDFLKTLQDPDLNVRRVALVTFNSAAHNKPSLIRDMLESVLPHLYNETKVRVSVFMRCWPRLVRARLLVLSLVFTTKPFCCFHVHFYACFCVCLPAFLSVSVSVSLCVFMTVFMSVSVPVYMCVFMSVFVPVYMSVLMTAFMSVSVPVYMCVFMTVLVTAFFLFPCLFSH